MLSFCKRFGSIAPRKAAELVLRGAPAETKRFILVASFVAAMAPAACMNGSCLSHDTIQHINNTMQLCMRDSAMLLPSYLRSMIWGGANLPAHSEILTASGANLDGIVAGIVDRIPDFLKYEAVKSDIHFVMSNFSKLFPSATA